MNKFMLFLVGGVAILVIASNLGHVVGLAVSLLLLYLIVKQFLKTDSTSMKIIWGIIGFIVLGGAAANIPAILAIAAAYVLYLVYKNWNGHNPKEKKDDPFANFEKQWAKLKKD